MASAARRTALRILSRVEAEAATLGDLLAEPDALSLDPRDRSFLHELVLGTLRHRGLVDHALVPLLDRPIARVQPVVRQILRLGAYQILRLRVPHRAAVDESVGLARGAAPKAAGFVNAVLRRLCREGAPPIVDPRIDPLGWLVTEGSLPRWLAEAWVLRWGAPVAVARARAFLAPPPAVFRINPRHPEALGRLREAGLDPLPLAVPGAWATATSSGLSEPAARGLVYVQAQGAQLIAHLAATPGVLLDACAAPGGKATLAADLVGPDGIVVAAEASPRRLRALTGLARRWGSPNLRCVGADALRAPFARSFDAVLLDAPCTGLGTLGRHPDIRWRVTPADVIRHAERQRELLAALADLVRPGGRLVYATCSVEPPENEEVVAALLAARSDFTPEPLPGWLSPHSAGPFLRTWPEAEGDAFFAAVLRRRA
jgi:16S rRNA (cytosine967-C5)-methyltransferase